MTFEMVSKLIPVDENVEIIVKLNGLKLEVWSEQEGRKGVMRELGHLPVAEVSANTDIGCLEVTLIADTIGTEVTGLE